jgi:uncharacterized membrane protein
MGRLCSCERPKATASDPRRRAALHHALLSYVFGTVIVATTVSSVAGLLGR